MRPQTTPATDRLPFGRRLVVMCLVAGAVLLYEIAITRLLSVVLWYHFAFLAVSLAMVGLGLPGVWYSLRPATPSALRTSLLVAGFAIPASILAILHPPWPSGTSTHLVVAWIAILVLVPLLALGTAVCLLLIEARGRRIATMYGADLLGATLAAALVVPLMHVVPTPQLLAGIGLLPLLALPLASSSRRELVLAAALALFLVGSLLWGTPYQLRHNKSYSEQELTMLHEKWTPTARLTVFPNIIWLAEPGVEFGWGMGTKFRGRGIDQYWIDQDGSAGTPLTRLEGSPKDLEHLFFDVTSAGFQFRPPAKVCVIGAGGGRDVLTALKAGAQTVDAVELNAHMIEIASDLFGEYSGDVYHLPGVNPVVSEGRSFLTRTETRYDIVQISLIDSWAATAAGAYALSENYLYTVEALDLYLDRLEEDGILSISRWMRGFHQLEGARLVLLAQEVLARRGVVDPKRHLAVLQGGRLATLLVSLQPFAETDIDRLDAIAEERGFTRHWPTPPNPVPSLVTHVLTTGTATLTDRGLYLDPPTDERPFFFQNLRAFSTYDPELLRQLSVNERAALLPRFLILGLGGATCLLFLMPFVLERKLERGQHFWRGSGYFLAIGLGFMLVEIPLIQKFILYLGHPSYATTVVLSGLLLGTGLGAIRTGQIDPHRLLAWRFLLPLAVAVANLVLPWLFTTTLGWPFMARVAASLMLIGPLGFLLGFAFPAGMMSFGETNRAWFWAINGAASVLASTMALALAAYVGLGNVVWIGAACYLVAGQCLPPSRSATGS